MTAKPIIYLAVPYSHPDEAVRLERFHRVNAAAASLMAQGICVFSPVSHSHPIASSGIELPTGWEFWGAYCHTMLSACKKLLVLKLEGWDKSIGVAGEIKLAKESWAFQYCILNQTRRRG
jgi:hypothetical protein